MARKLESNSKFLVTERIVIFIARVDRLIKLYKVANIFSGHKVVTKTHYT